VLACALAAWDCEPADGQSLFDRYALTEDFELPVGAYVFDVLPDGRLIALADDEVLMETALGSRRFMTLGTLPSADIASFGPAFVRVSPDGSQLAVGNNGGASFADFEVGVFDATTLSGTWFSAGHFDAEWADDRHLAITAGDFVNPSYVSLLDTQSTDPMNPSNPVILTNIGGASAGVTFDEAGHLYTGNGFSTVGPSGTGALKAFSPGDWSLASRGTPLDFENSGVLIVDLLSAASLGFDAEGHMHVGGGDFIAAETNFGGLVRDTAVQDALAGGGPVNPADANAVRRFDPDTENGGNFYSINANPVTQELYLHDSSSSTVFVYSPTADAAPAASTTALAMMAMALSVTGGVILLRRRVRT
jgi:hypothetical protein